jgi:hypothetical protein
MSAQAATPTPAAALTPDAAVANLRNVTGADLDRMLKEGWELSGPTQLAGPRAGARTVTKEMVRAKVAAFEGDTDTALDVTVWQGRQVNLLVLRAEDGTLGMQRTWLGHTKAMFDQLLSACGAPADPGSLPAERPEPEAPMEAPTVTALEPNVAVIGEPSFTLSVKGTGFAEGSVIVFNGYDEPTTVVSPTEVTTGINMDVWQGQSLPLPVTVRNLDGQVSNALTFTFNAAPEVLVAAAEPPKAQPAKK